MTLWRKKIARWRRSFGGAKPAIADTRKLIADSGLFDAAWYLERYTDIAQSGVDPLDHYVNHGGFEGRKAGPFFDSRWYADTYPDVRPSGLHPMIHYLRHGEGRETTKRVGLKGIKTKREDFAAAEEILASPLFDAKWYAARNGLDASGQTLALHYLMIGGPAGLPAGPRFDSQAYFRAYPDVRDAGINPLLHFLRNGEAEGRQAFQATTLGGSSPTETYGRRLSPARQPDADTVADHDQAWTPSNELAASPGLAVVQFAQVKIGLLPEVFGDMTAPLPSSLSDALNTFAELVGLESEKRLSARNGRRTRRIPPISLGETGAGPNLLDAWFIGDGLIRLRFSTPPGTDRVLRVLQADGNGGVALIGEAPIGDRASIVDAHLTSPFRPLLVIESDTAGELKGGAVFPYPSLFRGGPHHAETLSFEDGSDAMEKQARLSTRLLRDALGWPKAPPPQIATVKVDLCGATGAERVFSRPALAWLSELGVSVSGFNPGTEASAEAASYLTQALDRPASGSVTRGSDTLVIPCDALPTLSALMRRSAFPTGAGLQYLIADSVSCLPRWLVSLPPSIAKLDALQSSAAPLSFPTLLGSRSADRTVGGGGPLAIRFPAAKADSDPILSFPQAPDDAGSSRDGTGKARSRRGRICVVVHITDAMKAADLLESIARQSVASRIHVAAMIADDCRPQADVLLRRLFPDRYSIAKASTGPAAADLNATSELALSRADRLLFVSETRVLHDRRTVEVLDRMASTPGIASASCVQIRPSGFQNGSALQFHTGGLFPSAITLNSGPSITFATLDVRPALTLSTYPVAGNDVGLMMMSAAAWTSLGGFDVDRYPHENFDLDLSLRALKSGMTHACTSLTTATNLGVASFGRSRTASPDMMAFAEIAGLVDKVTILRALS